MARVLLVFVIAALSMGTQQVAAQSQDDLKYLHMHGWLMWASFGLLFPLGTIIIRYSRPQRDVTAVPSPNRVRILFYLHAIVMSLAVLAATAGVSVIIAKLGPSWDFTHQRLGLALFIIVLMQPFIGMIRPKKGKLLRPFWFVVHWVFGTGAVFLGIINCFIGIMFYEYGLKTSIRSLNIAFAIQVSAMAVIYFLQDRWSYIIGQNNAESLNLSRKSGAGRHQTMAL